MAVLKHTDTIISEKKNCGRCGKMLPKSWKDEYCDQCKEELLFDEVRDFIRSNNVTEQDVADHFGIPKAKVKQWIRAGRVEYKVRSMQE